jgi:iron complex outermembrane receptor protein
MAQVDEIIVTARKREESILDVPVAVSAISGDDLTKFNTKDQSSLTARVPGLVLGEQSSNIGTQLGMRGITQAQSNSGSDQSTSLVIDGLSLTQGVAYRSALFDMEAVEVLKGPQNLYYGKNSTAGVISIRTKNPGDEFEVVGTTSYEFAGQEKVGELIVSGPVTNTLGLRFAGRYSDLNGYFRNDAIGNGTTSLTPEHKHVPNKTDIFLRGTAVWKPTDSFDATLKVNYTHNKTRTNPSTIEIAGCPDGVGAVPGFGQYIDPRDTCRIGDKTVYIVTPNPADPANAGIPNNGRPYQDAWQLYGSLQMNYNIDDALTLSSITGHYVLDMEALFQPAFGRDITLAGAQHNMHRHDTTQEIRLASDFKSPVNFTVGSFFADGLTANTPRIWLLAPRDEAQLNIHMRTWSAFGQLLWDIVPNLQFAGGARWTSEKRHLDAFNNTRGGPYDGSTPQRPNVPVRDLSTNNVSPEVSLTWTPTSNFTLFGGYREATKSGSFQTNGNPAGQDISFGDESVTGFEGGIKSYLLDRQVAFNLSGYRYKYKDLQVGASITKDGNPQIITTNAAAAVVYGIDFDLTYVPRGVEGLTTFVSGAWTHARFGNFTNAPCYGGQTFALGCNQVLSPTTGLYTGQDLSGKPLLKAPDFQASFGFTYDLPLNDRMVLSLGSTSTYSTDYETDLKSIGRGDSNQKSYFKTNASIAVKDANDAWEVALIGSNLTDKITAGTCATSNIQGGLIAPQITGSPTNQMSPSGVEEVLCYTDPPRQVFLRLTLRPTAFR